MNSLLFIDINIILFPYVKILYKFIAIGCFWNVAFEILLQEGRKNEKFNKKNPKNSGVFV